MADETKIESLSLEISSNSGDAVKGIDKLASTLDKLKKAVTIESSSAAWLSELSSATKGLAALNGLKIPASLPKQLNSLGEAVRGFYGIQTADIADVAVSLGQLGDIGDIKLGPIVNQLKKLPEAAEGLKSIDAEDFRERISIIASAVTPLSNLGKNNLTSYITQLGKLPDIVDKLDDKKLDEFAEKIKKVTEAVKPLGTEMEKVSNGFSAFPSRIQRLIAQNDRLTTSNSRVGRSYTDLHHMVSDALTVLERGGRAVAQLINKENEYIENINLFNASMGEYAQEAQNYANIVGEIMGIDPGEWMRNQGVFQTLLTGFGVASDRAAVMSQQLTQLGYDLSSFFNISFADSMQKLQSGISGELEPLRRLGYDLSQAKLQQVALTLGIKENVSAMDQAEKAQLRYYAILTQVTTAQGDMARTLNAPANQLRIFNSQTEQASRALGSIFIPTLNALLPYGIAAAKVVRILATEIAALAGFELPEVDYSGITDVTGGVADNMESATESAKELKRTLLGIDEINRLGDNSSSGAGDSSGAGGLNFELPTYDFLDGAINSRVNEIVEDMKEWLGITEDIDTWAELMDTRFGSILKTVGLIGAGLLIWKLGDAIFSGLLKVKDFLDTIRDTSDRMSQIDLGIKLTLLGLAGSALSGYDMGKNGIDFANVIGEIISAALTAGGIALVTGSLTAGFVIGIPLSIAIASITYNAGVEAKYKEEFWNSETGQKIKEIKEDVEKRWDIVKQIHVTLETSYEEFQNEEHKWTRIRDLVEETFDLSDLEVKTPEQIQTIKENVETLNSMDLSCLQLTYDETTGKIIETREEVENLIKSQQDLALLTMATDKLNEATLQLWEAEHQREQLKYDNAETVAAYEQERAKLDELTAAAKENGAYWDLGTPPALLDFMHSIGMFNDAQYETITEYQKHKTALEELQPTYDEANEALRAVEEEIINARDKSSLYTDKIIQLREEMGLTSDGISDDIFIIQRATEGLAQAGQDCEVDFTGAFDDIATSTGSSLKSVEESINALTPAAQNASLGMRSSLGSVGSTIDGLTEKTRTLISMLSGNAASGMFMGALSGLGAIGALPPQYASGGIPAKGEMFIAREQGPELVGKIGGQTAVMNNGQIVQSVASGVRDANAEQNALLREQNSLLRRLLEKDPTVTTIISTQEIQRGMARNNRKVGKTVVPVG